MSKLKKENSIVACYLFLKTKTEYEKLFLPFHSCIENGLNEESLKEFFNNSPKQFASFYAEKTDLSKEDLESLKKIINSQIEKK